MRQAAAWLGVHRNTAFRWRHRLLSEVRRGERHPLGRVLSMGETAVYGRHWMLLVLDDRGRAAGTLTGERRAVAADFARLLNGRLEPGVCVVSAEGPFSAAARFAAGRGVNWRRRRTVGVEHDGIEPVVGYGLRFRRWLRRFRGVLPHYLDNYLAWFRLIDGGFWSGVCRGPLWPPGHIRG